jgi:hypothetical protein
MGYERDEGGFELENIEVLAVSDKAILVRGAGGDTSGILGADKVWIPRSHIRDGVEQKGERGSLCVSTWIAGQKGWL